MYNGCKCTCVNTYIQVKFRYILYISNCINIITITVIINTLFIPFEAKNVPLDLSKFSRLKAFSFDDCHTVYFPLALIVGFSHFSKNCK